MQSGTRAHLKVYVAQLHRTIRNNGSLLIIEIEKSDNIFTRLFFEDIIGFKEPPGLSRDELVKCLGDSGFENIEVTCKSGLLYSISKKK
jgi:hypothetical protein